MTQKTLVMYEISQKQNYIFRTNKLIENIGASMIIRQLTENPYELFKKKSVQLPKENTKIVGGGNAVYIFDDEEEGVKFAKQLTAGTLRHFPGVEMFLVMRKNLDWEIVLLYDSKDDQNRITKKGILSEMRDDLAKKKNERKHAVQQLSWGVHQVCSNSGLPANERRWDKDMEKNVPCAKELVVKEEMGKPTRDDIFQKRLLSGFKQKFVFLSQEHVEKVFDEEKGKDVKSYVAVVHIDGNAMGVKVGKFLQQTFASNDDYIKKYKQFTEDIDHVYMNAFQNTIRHIMNDYNLWAEKIYEAKTKEETKAKLEELANVIPLRPIVASGDDICLITYGQLGLESARIFIQYLQQESIKICNDKHQLEACAGVAIVRYKFPFWLAYELAEKLCSNAKKRLKADSPNWHKKGAGNKKEPFDTSLIDWHIVSGGDLQLDIDQVRQSSYHNRDGSYLIQRPYYVQRENKLWHDANYETDFLRTIKMIEKYCNDEGSSNPRSKWKALRDVYHQGEQAVEQWKILSQFDVEPNRLFLSLNHDFEVYGITKQNVEQRNAVATFYDALEVMDYFIPLSEVKET